MKQLTLSLIFFLVILIFSSTDLKSQNQQLIDLKNFSGEIPSVNYYVLDVIDGREVHNLVGMVKSEGSQEIAMLNFSSGFQNELYEYFAQAYPAASGKNPVILNFNKLWVNEFEKDGSTYSKCEIELEFLTPKKQMFYKCNQNHEAVINANHEIHKENIIITLNKCIQSLDDTEIQKEYYTVLNSEKPGITNQQSPETNQKGQSSLNNVSGESFDTFSKTRITLQGGYTYRIAKLPDDINSEYESHLNNLKSGFHLGSDINYFMNKNNAFGVSVSYSNAKSTLQDVSGVDEFGNIIATGDLTENIKLLYFGPSYFSRYINPNGKTHWLYSMTAGYYTYDEDFEWLGETVDITGGTVGFGFSLGVDFLSSENLALGLQVSALMGWLNKFNVDGDEVDLDESENLSRIDLTFGIRFLP